MKKAFFDVQLRAAAKKNAVLAAEKNMRNGFLKYERMRVVNLKKKGNG